MPALTDKNLVARGWHGSSGVDMFFRIDDDGVVVLDVIAGIDAPKHLLAKSAPMRVTAISVLRRAVAA
ncbi:MAG: hypothetical protein WCS43_11050 [Verrucomicrobiota bacterium]